MNSKFLDKKKYKYINFFFFLFAFISHQMIFLKFFPNERGFLGNDYEQFLPNFVYGKIWFENNFLSIPWFNPSFCCGTPFYSDPQTAFYSIHQIFYILFQPVFATKILFIYFSLMGYLGMFFLLNKNFKLSFYLSLLGATMFIFNGFFTYRAIIGHVAYINFILIPLYCFFLIESFSNKNFFLKNIFLFLSVLVLSSLFYSGAGPIMPLILCCIFSILLFYFLKNKNFIIIFKALLKSLILTLLISSSKISASLFYLNNFSRKLMPSYFDNVFDYLNVVFKSLFFYPDIQYFNSTIKNQNIKSFGIHEIEFGLTVIPLISFIFLIFNFKKIIDSDNIKKLFLVFIIIFFIPIILNTNFFSIQDIWNKLPIVGSSWVQIRWSAFYIIPLIFFSIFVLNNFNFLKKNNFFLIVLLLIVVFQNINRDKGYYENQYYNPGNLVKFWKKIETSSNSNSYKINGVATIIDSEGKLKNQGNRNDLFVFNFSSLFCYQPLFGYGLENFPHHKIIFTKKEEIAPNTFLLFGGLNDNIDKKKYNFLNPSCFLFPKENNCVPGDLFTINQKKDLEKFLKYKSINFKKNIIQYIFDYLSIATFLFLLVLIFVNCFFYYKKKLPEISF